MKTDYIVGYGSLINAESREKTGASGQGIPVKIQGVQRSWSQCSLGSRMTVVGVHVEENRHCNGVIFPICSKDLPRFDAREALYSRQTLSPQRVIPWGDHALPSGNFWIYFAKQSGFPSEQSPLVQSYLDVCLSGCLEIGEDFAHEFIKTTTRWSPHWVNDRHQPRYPLFMEEIPWADQIDALLNKGVFP